MKSFRRRGRQFLQEKAIGQFLDPFRWAPQADADDLLFAGLQGEYGRCGEKFAGEFVVILAFRLLPRHQFHLDIGVANRHRHDPLVGIELNACGGDLKARGQHPSCQ